MTASSTSRSEKCLFLVAEKGKYPVSELLKPLNAIYNGTGWFIEEKHREAAEKISHQAEMTLIDWTLDGEDFEHLRRSNKIAFFRQKSAETRLKIDGLKATLGIHDLDNENLLNGDPYNSLQQSDKGKELIDVLHQYDNLQDRIKQVENEEKISVLNVPQIVSIEKRIESHNETLKKYRGKKYLGLCVKTIKEFNDKMLGLRKLILLAAAPNVGKTALTIQLATEVLLTEPDSCLLYVSLEMDAEEIFTRMNLYLSGLDFNTYVFGSQQANTSDGYQNFFSQEELRRITNATKQIEDIGDRLQIIDASSCLYLNADFIIKCVEALKAKTKCSRAIVVIDYLQVWPIPPNDRFSSDLEADKWRIGEIKKIRDALQKENQDPVIVISEARKPSTSNDSWGSELSDVMGSARGTYTPDAVLLLSTLQPKDVDKLCEKMNEKETLSKNKEVFSRKTGIQFDDIQQYLAHHGISFCNLKMAKGRDGMKRFNINLAFHYRKNKFEAISWPEIKILVNDAQGSP